MGSTRKAWGRIQKIETADDKMNKAQMTARAKALLKEYEKVERTMSITAIGDLRIRAGVSFWLKLQALADIGVGTRRVMPSKVTHHFGVDWTMDIDLEM